MSFNLNSNGLRRLLEGKTIEIAGSCEVVELRLNDESLATVTDRRIAEIFAEAEKPIHGLHL